MALRRNLPSIQEKSSPLKKVALDLDGTLVSSISKEELKRSFGQWFRLKKLAVKVDKTYYIIHPGVIEFIRYLKSKNIDFCFFSHGTADRNHRLARKIVKRVLSKSEYKAFKKNIINNVYSRLDCDEDYAGKVYKDLHAVLKSEDLLDSTIIIDDQHNYIPVSQKANGLILMTSNAETFEYSFEPQTDHSLLMSANQIFYAAGMLERLMQDPLSKAVPSLYEIQYQDDGLHKEWYQDIGIVLISYASISDRPGIEKLSDLSDYYRGAPILMKIEKSNELILFGKPDGINWKFTSLDASMISSISFPKPKNKDGVFLKKFNMDNFYILSDIILKQAHLDKRMQFNYQLLYDKSLYLDGLKVLLKFSSDSTFKFYGYGAEKYFGSTMSPLRRFSLLPPAEPVIEEKKSIEVHLESKKYL